MCLRLAICGFNVWCLIQCNNGCVCAWPYVGSMSHASFSVIADGTLVVAVIQSGKVSSSSWIFNDVPVGFNSCEGNNLS